MDDEFQIDGKAIEEAFSPDESAHSYQFRPTEFGKHTSEDIEGSADEWKENFLNTEDGSEEFGIE